MIKSYLPRRIKNSGITLLFLFWLFGLSTAFTFFFILFALCYFLFREDKAEFKEDAAIKDGVLFAPVYGEVISIEKDVKHSFFGERLIEVRVWTPFWRRYGVFLPSTSEVTDILLEKGEGPLFLGREKSIIQKDKVLPGLCLSLTDVATRTIGLHFIKYRFGLWPEIAVIPGDRGKRQVSVGFLPFGGTTLLYLPEEYEILIKINQELVAGQTLIAGLSNSGDEKAHA